MSAAFQRMLLALAARTPRTLARLFAALFANLNLWMKSTSAEVTCTNLQACFPELDNEARTELARASLANMALLFFEFGHLSAWPRERLMASITEEHGKAILDEAYASDRGVLLLVPHFGNWELLCAYLGTHYKFAALYDPPRLASTEAIILEARQRFEGELYPIDTGGMRGLLRAMRDGKIIAVLPDQVPRRRAGVYAPFFGQPALTMTLVHRLLRNDPHVILGTVQRLVNPGQMSYALRFEALDLTRTGDDAESVAAAMNASIETAVRRAPEQYQWEYKRFRRPPQGDESSIYQP